MKTYRMTLTQDQAEAIGFALKRASRSLEETKASDDRDGDSYWKTFRQALKDAYDNLDTCEEVEA